MADEIIPQLPPLQVVNIDSASLDLQVVVSRAEATKEAVEYARQAVAIPAEERTKQAEQTTKQAVQSTIRSGIATAGSVAALFLAPASATPWIAGTIAFGFLVAAGAWLLDGRTKSRDQKQP